MNFVYPSKDYLPYCSHVVVTKESSVTLYYMIF